MKHLVIGSFALLLIATTPCKKETIASNEIVDTVSKKPYYTSVTLDGVTSTYSNNFPTIDTLATSGYANKDDSNNGQFVFSLLTSLSNNGIYTNLIDKSYVNKKSLLRIIRTTVIFNLENSKSLTTIPRFIFTV